MSSAKHTLGTWYACEWTCHAKTTVVVDDPTANVTGKRIVAECETEEDARLIAASPELLEALQAFMALDESFSTTCQHHLNEMAKTGPLARAVQLARAAISKATGQ